MSSKIPTSEIVYCPRCGNKPVHIYDGGMKCYHCELKFSVVRAYLSQSQGGDAETGTDTDLDTDDAEA